MQQNLLNMKLMQYNVFILLDENIPFDLIHFLKKRNYIVEHIKKIGKAGIKNGEVYQYAEIDKKWIVTRDADFENYFKFQKYNIGGIILFKTSLTNKSYLLKVLNNFLEKYSEKLKYKCLITIEDKKITFLD